MVIKVYEIHITRDPLLSDFHNACFAFYLLNLQITPWKTAVVTQTQNPHGTNK